MESLRHATTLARAGRGQVVAAMADPGVGKSGLFHEFKLISQSEWMTLEGIVRLARQGFQLSAGY
jgi:flagellar biosynthesis/type III secretory pathway ATPase